MIHIVVFFVRFITNTSEIPLYHVLNACISFGNIHGLESAVYGVSTVPLSQSEIAAKSKSRGDSGDSTNQPLLNSSESGQSANSAHENVKCVIDDSVFDVGKGYHVIGTFCLPFSGLF